MDTPVWKCSQLFEDDKDLPPPPLPEKKNQENGTHSQWSSDLYAGGLDRLKRIADRLDPFETTEGQNRNGGHAMVPTTALLLDELLPPSTHIPGSSEYLSRSAPSTPSRSVLSFRSSDLPPLPRQLPLRTVSRTASKKLPSLTTSPTAPLLKRAATLRAPASPSILVDGLRPQSSYSPDTEFPGYRYNPTTASAAYPALMESTSSDLPEAVPVLARREMNEPVLAPKTLSRTRTLSKSTMRQRSLSMRSAATGNETMFDNVAAMRQDGRSPRETLFSEKETDQIDVPSLRPRAPTPSALPPTTIPYSPDFHSPGSNYSNSTMTPQLPLIQPNARMHGHTSSTSSVRARSRSISAGRPSTPPQFAKGASEAPLLIPDEYVIEAYPTTPPQSFARPPKQTPSSYPDPTGFPTPPSYPPVPGLVACGSSSTSTRSSSYTSPGASAPLSSSDLSALGFGLGRLVNREDGSDAAYVEDGDSEIGAAIATDKTAAIPPRTSYTHAPIRESSESSIARLQFAANAAAASATNGNIVVQGWGEPSTASTPSGSSSYEGSPNPTSRTDQQPKKLSTVWRTVDETGHLNSANMDQEDLDTPSPPPSSFTYQRPRHGTVGSSRSASTSGLTSASEDETDADEYNYNFLQEIDEGDEAARTAAVVVAEEGRGLIIHAEGQDVASVNIQLGTTHLLLASSATPNSIPSLLTQTLPSIANTLLALDISANFLGALPPALEHCTQLTELNIASNPLRALPVWLAKLEDLRVLIVDATGINTLPPELAALKALNVLSIRRNKFISLPPWLSHLPALERLEVEGNPFQGPWKSLLAPLMAGHQLNASSSVPGQQTPSISTSSSISDFNSLYGPGMSMYAESSTSFAPSDYHRTPQSLAAPYSATQGSFMSATDSEYLSSMPTSAVESDANGGRRFLQDEEDHTIMPRSFTSPSQTSFTRSSQLAVPSPSIPISPLPPTASSQRSFVSSLNSPSQLPYMSTSPPFTGSSEQGFEEVRHSTSSSMQRVPTFSVSDRRTPSPYLRPLSRTRTIPSRSRMSSGSANGSIATFIAEKGQDGSRTRTSSTTSQRPHTDYATRYDRQPGVDDSGYYGSVVEYSAYQRKSDGSEFFGGFGNGQENGGAKSDVEDEKKKELRRMRSADELRRALESVLSPPSEAMSPTREEDDTGGDTTETDRRPPFFISKMDARPGMKQYQSADAAGTFGSIQDVPLADRPVAKRFVSMSAAPTRIRPALTDGMWDAGVDADAEGDNEESRLSVAKSPTTGGYAGETRQAKPSKGKWGFLKKMSMGRMRPEASSRPSTSAGTPTLRSAQTSPQSGNSQRTGIPPAHISNGASPTPKPRQYSRDVLSSLQEASTLPPPPLNTGFGYRSQVLASPSSLNPPQLRSARRRSFLPLDGPPALNIPIPSTSPFLPETIITNDGNEEPMKSLTLDTPIVELPPAVPELSQQFANDTRALRSVMLYLRDMADLGMANSAAAGPILSVNPSLLNLASQEVIDGRSKRPNAVEIGRVMSEGSLTSSSSSGPTSSSRSDEQRANTMSTATTDSNGSGKDEERSKHKDDKSRRALIIKEIVETERTYVQGLQELLDIYIKPASLPVNTLGNAVASTKETVIPQQERKIVFNGLDSLYSFHSQSFLPALEHAAKPLLYNPSVDATVGEVSMAAAMAIANVFVSHAAFMRMYSTYINNFDNAVQRLKQWSVARRTAPGSSVTSPNSSTVHLAGMGLQMSVVSVAGVGDNASSTGLQPLTTSQRKRIKQYLKRCRLSPKHSQINLEAYLLLPIQRIPRYRMLLEELVRCTPPIPDALDDPMDRALNEISLLANNMNEGKRESESRRRLIQWQTRIRGKFPSPLVQPHRRLIMDGPLNLTRVVRKSAMAFDVINSEGDKTNVQVECLAPETTPRSLVGILCNDLLVLCKDQTGGQDQTAQVDLWAVLRMQTLPQPASIYQGGALRVVDNKAILYFDAPSTSEALTWSRAINMHIPVTKP